MSDHSSSQHSDDEYDDGYDGYNGGGLLNEESPESLPPSVLHLLSQMPDQESDDNLVRTIQDEKGVESLVSTGSSRVDMSFKLVRNLNRTRLHTHLAEVLVEARSLGKSGHISMELEAMVDAVVLLYQTRDPRGGKGERVLFYWFLLALHEVFPKTIEGLLKDIPGLYGGWMDVVNLLLLIDSDLMLLEGGNDGSTIVAWAETKEKEQERLHLLSSMMMDMITTQLTADSLALSRDGDKASLSLCAKWVPRECSKKKKHSALARRIAEKMTESPIPAEADDSLAFKVAQHKAYKSYRQLVSRLNKGTAEVIMTSTTPLWDTLDPSKIPSKCLLKNRTAFLNRICPATTMGHSDKAKHEYQVAQAAKHAAQAEGLAEGTDEDEEAKYDENGKFIHPARSDRPDRIACAEKFIEHMEKAIKDPSSVKINAKVLHPHEIVRIYFNANDSFSEENIDITMEAQWAALRKSILDNGTLGNFVPLVDVSGSMQGTPMEVAIAMGILVSECCHPAFRNQFITFEESPKWVHLTEGDSLLKKVTETKSAPWGGSTDFDKAMNLVLQNCVENSIPPEVVEATTLAVFSDMQFNDSNRNPAGWESKYAKIQQMFAKKGFPVPPRILFWNLRGNTLDFPADANTPGVDMVSGFSVSALKGFMDGALLSLPPGVKPTPMDGLRVTLDDERYDRVRQVCESIGEIVSFTDPTQKYIVPPKPVEELEAEAGAETGADYSKKRKAETGTKAGAETETGAGAETGAEPEAMAVEES